MILGFLLLWIVMLNDRNAHLRLLNLAHSTPLDPDDLP